MDKIDFTRAAMDLFPEQALLFTSNEVIWECLEKMYHSERMQKRLGFIDTDKRFVQWISKNPAVLYRMVRAVNYKLSGQKKRVHNGVFRHFSRGFGYGSGLRIFRDARDGASVTQRA